MGDRERYNGRTTQLDTYIGLEVWRYRVIYMVGELYTSRYIYWERERGTERGI